jgi:outer membrane protein assembly factor BamD (BamD/ComL family)
MFAMSAGHFLKLAFDGLLLVLITGFIGWFFIRTIANSEDPKRLIFKWVLTVGVAIAVTMTVRPLVKIGGVALAYAVPVATVAGLFLAIVWRRDIAELIAVPFGNLYTGGSAPPEPKPVYSPALALRNRGNYLEALNSVRKQLEKFPGDFEGQLLLADIQAENLNDLPGAAITIERIFNQPEHPPRNIALALNTLTDWYLKYNQDRHAARETLQRIIDRFPDSEFSLLAAQRIASLASTEHLLAPHDRKKFAVVEGVQNLGLLDPKFHPQPASADAAKQAADLVAHLHSHPLDGESREKLAVIYADHYNRLDLATDQLEQLINPPNQPQKRVAHRLNLLTDLQIRHGADYETARATLQRIVDLFPTSAVGDVAANRITHLKLELKARETKPSIKLGTYEQDIGLKK